MFVLSWVCQVPTITYLLSKRIYYHLEDVHCFLGEPVFNAWSSFWRSQEHDLVGSMAEGEISELASDGVVSEVKSWGEEKMNSGQEWSNL